MEKQKRAFKGVWIPREIWLNKDLNILEKCVFVEIDSLDNEKGCFASNKYLAEFLGTSESKITKTIAKLIEMGLIKQLSFNGRQRCLGSNWGGRLVKSTRQTSKKSEAIYNNKVNNKVISAEASSATSLGDKNLTNSSKEPITLEMTKADEKLLVKLKKEAEEKNFSSEEHIKKMLVDKQPHIRLIACYMDFKKMYFPTKNALNGELKRNLRASRELADYEDDRINGTIDYIVKQDFLKNKWTLETVLKYINNPEVS